MKKDEQSKTYSKNKIEMNMNSAVTRREHVWYFDFVIVVAAFPDGHNCKMTNSLSGNVSG